EGQARRRFARHYNYFRDYDPAVGRYVQSDPIGLRGGLNTYAYSLDDPLDLVDFDGRQFSPDRTRDRPGRDRPGADRKPGMSAGTSQSERQACYAECIDDWYEHHGKKVVLACTVVTAAAGVGGFLGGGPPLAGTGVAAGVAFSAGAIGAFAYSVDRI